MSKATDEAFGKGYQQALKDILTKLVMEGPEGVQGDGTDQGPPTAGISGQLVALQPDGPNIISLWTHDFPEGVLTSAPAVANGIVYAGDGAKNVYALDALTGDTLWSGLTAGTIDYSSAAVSNGEVFVGGDKRLFAFALNGGNDVVYRHRHVPAPRLASLHPDYGLKPSP